MKLEFHIGYLVCRLPFDMSFSLNTENIDYELAKSILDQVYEFEKEFLKRHSKQVPS